MANSMPTKVWSFKTEDATAPSIPFWSPTGIDVPTDEDIVFDITDTASGVDLTTLNVSINGVAAVVNGSPLFGYSLSTSPIVDGHQVTVGHPELPGITVVPVVVDCRDVAGNLATKSWDFTTAIPDLLAPTITNEDPVPLSSGIDNATDIYFELDDDVSGVDLSTLTVHVNGDLAIDGSGLSGGGPWTDIGEVGFVASDIVADGLGFNVTVVPDTPLPEGQITIAVYVEDNTGKVLDTSYYFTTLSNAPIIINQDPGDGETGFSRATAVTFGLRDPGESGVNKDSIDVTIDGVPAVVDGLVEAAFIGSVVAAASGYDISLLPVSGEWYEGAHSIQVYCEDFAVVPNVLSTSYGFTTVTAAPTIEDVFPVPDTSNADVDTTISFSLRDYGGAGINISTINVTVGGTLVIDGGVPVPASGFSATVTEDSGTPELDYLINIEPDTPFDVAETVVVEVSCYDLASPVQGLVYSYQFATGIERPTAVISYNTINALLGSVIQLDGRRSFDPNGLPLTWYWTFTRVPVNSGVDATQISPLKPNSSAVSFIPDLTGAYEVQLVVSNGFLSSDPVTATISIGLSQVPCGEGIIPDAGFLWNYISNFWNLVEDRDYIESVWSATIQLIGADLIKLWSSDYSKSLKTIQENVRRKWQQFSLRTDLTTETQRVVAGNTDDGLRGRTGLIGPQAAEHVGSEGTAANGETFTGSVTVPAGYVVVKGSVEVYKRQTGFPDELVGYANDAGEITGTGGYSISGTYDYETNSYSVVESGAVWGVNQFVLLKYSIDSEYTDEFFLSSADLHEVVENVATGTSATDDAFTATLGDPVGSRIAPGTVELWNSTTNTKVGEDDGAGNIVGFGGVLLSGSIDYDTWEADWQEGQQLWDTDEVVRFEFDVQPYFTSFSTVDSRRNARGRMLVVNGEGYTINRVFDTGTESVIQVDQTAIPGGLTNATWRIPHLLQVPAIDLENFGVRVGDIVVFDVRRRDLGLSSELHAQVVGVDRDSVGFEFTLEALSPGDPTIDLGQFEQVVRDLKIVPVDANDYQVAAAAAALVTFIPVSTNISTRPFTPYRITIKAREIIHNSAIRVHSKFVSIPSLQEELFEPPVVLRENWDYILGEGEIQFQAGLFGLSSPSPESLWAECTLVDNIQAIENNFGRLIGIGAEDLEQRTTRVSYLSAVKGLWYAVTNGPTVANIRLGLQILLGLPYAEERGRIKDLQTDFSTEAGTGVHLGRLLVDELDESDRPTGRRKIYFYPTDVGLEVNPRTGFEYAAGDIIDQWSPISKGVEVTDYVKDPTWWRRALQGLEVLKYFVFSVSIDGTVFDIDDVQFAVDFLKTIKPSYTKVLVSIFKELYDTPLDPQPQTVGQPLYPGSIDDATNPESNEVTDKISHFGGALTLYDNPFWGLPAYRLDQLNHQGVPSWGVGSHPVVTKTSSLLWNIETREGTPDGKAGKVVAEAADGWVQTSVFSQALLGSGTAGIADTFNFTLSKPAGSRIVPRSISIRKNGTGSVGSGDPLGYDDGNGNIVGDGISGTVNYNTGAGVLTEVATQVWDAGDTANADYSSRGTPIQDPIRARQAGDSGAGTEFPVREGDLLVLHKAQDGSGSEYGVYEIEEVLDEYRVVLRSSAGLGDPLTYDTAALDSSIFPYATGLRGGIVRRMTNPLVKGEDLVLSSVTNVVTSAGSTFVTDRVLVDDHIIIEEGASAGEEYRIESVNSETSLELIGINGVTPVFSDETDIRFRVIKPILVATRIPGARSFYDVTNTRTEIEVMDPGLPGGAPPGTPLDVFTPEMVGMRVSITGSDNPSNNGVFTITEYIHPGRVATDSAVGSGSDDTAATAILQLGPKKTSTKWESGVYQGFENIQEMGPSEVVEAELTT